MGLSRPDEMSINSIKGRAPQGAWPVGLWMERAGGGKAH